MNITVTGKNMQVGEALTERVETQIQQLLEKYFGGRGEANIVLSKEASGFQSDIKVHLANRVVLHSHSQGHGDATSVYMDSEEKIAKQLRRYKRRLNDIVREDEASEDVTEYVLRQQEEEEDHPEESALVIAEQSRAIENLTVSDAVMRLDLANMNHLLFRNAGNNRLNLVYRRQDGHFGWLNPEQ